MEAMSSMNEETYLGDGLYASFDGWHIILRAPRADGDHFVALEPSVFAELKRYQQRILDAQRAVRESTEAAIADYMKGDEDD
jgi:hypothetical protein